MVMRMNRKIIPVILAVLMICALFTGCSEKNSGEYVSLGEYEITEAHYKYFITKGYDAAFELTGVSDMGLLEEKIDGVSGDKWIKDYAVKLAKRYLLVNRLFDEAGLELTDEDTRAVQTRFDDEWYYTGRLSVYGPMGVVEDTYMDILTNEKKQEKLAEHYADELKGTVTDAQVEERFQRDYASARYIALNYVNGDNESTLDRYNEYKEQLEGGKTLDELISELQNSGDKFVITSIDGGTGKRDVVFTRTGSIFPLRFVNELFDTEVGGVIYYDDTANMIYVIAQRTDIMADGANLEAYRTEVIDSLVSEMYTERLDTEAERYDFSVNKSNTGGIDIKSLYGL